MIKLKEGNYASTLEFARDGSSIIAGTNKGTIFTITCLSWDTFSNLQYQELLDLDSNIQSCQYSPLEMQSKFIVGSEGMVRIFEKKDADTL